MKAEVRASQDSRINEQTSIRQVSFSHLDASPLLDTRRRAYADKFQTTETTRRK